MLSMGCDPLDLNDLRQDWHPNFKSLTFDSEYQFPTVCWRWKSPMQSEAPEEHCSLPHLLTQISGLEEARQHP
jgi:hypothetical protein